MAEGRWFWSVVALPFLLGACATDSTYVGVSRSVDPVTGELRSQPSVNIPASTEISAETLGGAGAVYLFGHPTSSVGLSGKVFSNANAAVLYLLYDPLAPNWSIKEQALAEDTYALFLRAKSFRTGGDGEAIQILKRRALQLQREKGYSSYRILDYSEGVDSNTPLTHRYSEGTIQLVRAQPTKR